jgi:hypothetical protein
MKEGLEGALFTPWKIILADSPGIKNYMYPLPLKTGFTCNSTSKRQCTNSVIYNKSIRDFGLFSNLLEKCSRESCFASEN